jgi:exosortase F-associated protein
MSKARNFFFIVLGVGCLILIRFFEEHLFYDPYLNFFKNDYLYIDSPRRETFKLVLFTTLRYMLNSLISLVIIYNMWNDKGIVKFASLIYVISYCFLVITFIYFVVNPKQEDYYLFFNMRRFLIQPMILIILLPAFYYNKLKN